MRVQTLTTAQLMKLLQRRGVRLPERPQSQAFYVEQCRQHGIFEVDESELKDQTSGSSIEIGVEDLTLLASAIRGQPRYVSVRIEALGMEDAPLETQRTPVSGSLTRLDWAKTLELRRGERAWEALSLALSGSEEACNIYFTVHDETSSSPVLLGEALINLQRMLMGSEHRI